ncbi:MAG TPA: N-acetyl-gamma-glutamyl-phosphate reductase [Pyrinomonadaceae bacterium]|nr:N-acetyl-gamma-glutamyl-phosphate reductase [Pyrinomonadaceae bacterium]
MTNSNKIKVGIFGGSGYGGSELLRILLFHPAFEVAFVSAGEHAGKPVASVHKNLNKLTDLAFISSEKALELTNQVNAIFLALPHGQAIEIVPQLSENIVVIDLSGDFRLDDESIFLRYYKREHPGNIQKKFVYGITELNREEISNARLISNPGCFATATLLALGPLYKEGLVVGSAIIDAKTGSSGSGAKAAQNTHHPQRSNSFYAYKPFEHQHLPEIKQTLDKLGAKPADLIFTTHSMPVSRGIFASCYVELSDKLSQKDLQNVFQSFYEDSFFVRLVETSPDINWVKNTNFCDIAVNTDGKFAAVFSAIDNLVKGAAGQAVQNLNLIMGRPETEGLIFTGSNP